MVEFFAKRGIPWCGVMFIRLKTEDEVQAEPEKEGRYISDCVVDFMDCIAENTKEDGHAASSILEGCFNTYKWTNPHITKTTIMTDGAGCFSGVYFFLFLGKLGKLTGFLNLFFYILALH